MVINLRNKDKQNVVDIEINVAVRDWNLSEYVDLRISVDLELYSKILLDNIDRKEEVIDDFVEIDQLRTWLHESFLMLSNTVKDYQRVVDAVKKRVTDIGDKYGLGVNID